MSACAEWNDALVEFVFGELDDVGESRLNEHLGTCGACRKEEMALLQLRGELAADAESPTAELRERTRAAVSRRRRPRRFTGYLLRPIPIYAALVAALAGALLASLLPTGAGSDSVPSHMARRPLQRVAGSESPPFHIAGSYDTGVQPALYEELPRGTAPPARSEARDSL